MKQVNIYEKYAQLKKSELKEMLVNQEHENKQQAQLIKDLRHKTESQEARIEGLIEAQGGKSQEQEENIKFYKARAKAFEEATKRLREENKKLTEENKELNKNIDNSLISIYDACKIFLDLLTDNVQAGNKILIDFNKVNQVTRAIEKIEKGKPQLIQEYLKENK